MPHFIHHSEDNYLKELYKLFNSDVKKVNNTALARALKLNPATVLEMVRKLVKKKLVEQMPDKTILLTDKGRKQALLTIRKHRLWEVFLVEKLGYKWNEVHELAEQLEHIESTSLTDRLEAFLGHPGVDPHGDPIPDRNGRIRQVRSIPLADGEPGRSYIVVSLAETDDAFLNHLDKLKIQPGSRLKIIDQNEYDASLTVGTGKRVIHLTEKVARKILVKQA